MTLTSVIIRIQPSKTAGDHTQDKGAACIRFLSWALAEYQDAARKPRGTVIIEIKIATGAV
jgi:hypothetical protein